MTTRTYVQYNNIAVPEIKGAGGGKGGGVVVPNSMLSGDLLVLTVALGEGPLYRINPNGPQDIEIQDSSIDDLLLFNSNTQILSNAAVADDNVFVTSTAYGTLDQSYLKYFGEGVVSPQVFAAPVILRKGNIVIDSDGNDLTSPVGSVDGEQTSADAWDALRFNFIVNQLYTVDSDGNVKERESKINIVIKDNAGIRTFYDSYNGQHFSIIEKTDTAAKRSITIPLGSANVDPLGYTFYINKVTDEVSDYNQKEEVGVIGWDEIKDTKLAYPRTALIGYAVKATPEHTGGVPNFTSLIKGLIVKVPSNYNQPILPNGEIDWRQVEVSTSDLATGYRLQSSGVGTVLTSNSPSIYLGTWDGTFVYSWTQNPVWIIYDILTNQSYGLSIPEDNIDKYKFYQIAQYCDACSQAGQFVGVDSVADGSFRHKPFSSGYSGDKKNQYGYSNGTPIKERRFTLDISLLEQEKAMDVLNKLAASFRGILVTSGGKISLSADMEDEYPVMFFNDSNIKRGSLQLSGNKESDILTGVDVTYVNPTNHYKRETIRVNTAEANDGSEVADIDNILSLDLTGVTRRGQAMRMAQYHIASSRYVRRNISFTTSTEALSLSPGDLISVATTTSGVNYGYGGKVSSNSVSSSANTNVYLEHFTYPTLSASTFSNTYPLALRIIKANSDAMDLYILSNTDYTLSSTSNVVSGYDYARVNVTKRFDKVTKALVDITSAGFNVFVTPSAGDLWSIGEWENPTNYYTNKSGRLFKVTSMRREVAEEEVSLSAQEYISNVYEDTESFINYQPTAYVDILSPLSAPPTPNFNFTTTTRRTSAGIIVVDGLLQDKTDKTGYDQKFETEYYVAYPSNSHLVANIVSAHNTTFAVNYGSTLTNKSYTAMLSGKNGFTVPVGSIKLLCNNYAVVGSDVVLTVEGLYHCTDINFNKNILAVNDSGLLKGTDKIVLPVVTSTESSVPVNFVSYASSVSTISREVVSYDAAANTITISNIEGIDAASSSTIASLLPDAPFNITIQQILAAGNYANNSFYLQGSEFVRTQSGTLSSSTQTIDLEVKPRVKAFVRFFADGILKSSSAYTLNRNLTTNRAANIVYIKSATETAYRVEIDYYAPPAIEPGDQLEIGYNNTFTVVSSSFQPGTATYDQQLIDNYIYRVTLDSSPTNNLAGSYLINISDNPIGTISNITANSFQFSYSSTTYPGTFNLANSEIYTLDLDSSFKSIYLSADQVLPDLRIGTTIVKARNRNTLGRTSPYSQKYVQVEAIPIQKVTNLEVQESIVQEQLGGTSIRATVIFDHIPDQDVTDYEVSFKLAESTVDVNNDYVTDYNTAKVPAAGVDSAGKIRYTINGLNRGGTSGVNYLSVRVTPLNGSIRGITAEIQTPIVGDTVAPSAVTNVSASQLNDTMSIHWSYNRTSDGLLSDLDLKEVHIRRLAGSVSGSVENFVVSKPIATLSAGTESALIPIDAYGSHTYLIRTIDTSDNWSDSVVALTANSVRPYATTVMFAFNEDNPSEQFTAFPNYNNAEYYFASFSNSINGGFAPGSTVENANGSSSGFSAIALAPTDLLASSNATYITQVRDLTKEFYGRIELDINGTQQTFTTYNDSYTSVLGSVSDLPLSALTYVNNVSVKTEPRDIFFSPDGANMYVVSSTTDDINQYNLASSWNIATASYLQNVSVATSEAIPTGIAFSSNGGLMYVTGTAGDNVSTYNLAVAWNISTSSFRSNTFIRTPADDPSSLRFSDDGLNVYVISDFHDNVVQYSLNTAWDASNINFVTNIAIGSGETSPRGLAFTDNGYRMYVTGSLNDNLTSYTLSTQWGVNTAVLTDNISLNSIDSQPTGIFFSGPANKFYFSGTSSSKVYAYNVAATAIANVLVDSDFGGIGAYISTPNGRYDANNKTWMSGGADGNVWAIWNPGQFNNDTANANSYALIAGIINSNAIALGNTYYANGLNTTNNGFSNVTSGGSSYILVNLHQYSDTGSTTFAGTLGAITAQTFVRTAPDVPYVYYANGNVNVAAFTAFTAYEPGTHNFRYIQLKHEIINNKPTEVNYTLDKFRYVVTKEQTTYTNTVVYDNIVETVDYVSANFFNRPSITLTILDQIDAVANPAIGVITAASNQNVKFSLVSSSTAKRYLANSTANVMVTAIGV